MKPKQKAEINRYIVQTQNFSDEFWRNPLNIKIYLRSITVGLDPDDADRYAILCGLIGKNMNIETFQEVNHACCCQDIEIFDLKTNTEEWEIVLNILQTLGIETDGDNDDKKLCKWIKEHDADDFCQYCSYECSSSGVKGGPDGPIYPPCANWNDEELLSNLNTESILESIYEESEI